MSDGTTSNVGLFIISYLITYVGLSFGVRRRVGCGIDVEVFFQERILSFKIFNFL